MFIIFGRYYRPQKNRLSGILVPISVSAITNIGRALLTMVNQILRLYISKENPNKHLVTLVNYIVKVYAPTWFEIKSKLSCTDGSRHLFHMIHHSLFQKLVYGTEENC